MLFRRVEVELKRFWPRWSKQSSISRFSLLDLMWWNITFGKDELGIYPLVIRDLIISPCQKLRENETEAHGKLDTASRWRKKLYSADLLLTRIKNHTAKIYPLFLYFQDCKVSCTLNVYESKLWISRKNLRLTSLDISAVDIV